LRAVVRVGPQLFFLFLILVILFDLFHPKYFSPGWNFEAPLLLLVTNAVFSIMALAVAAIELRGYLANDSATLLFLGSGMLALDSAFFVAGWLGAQVDANVNLPKADFPAQLLFRWIDI